MEWRESRRRTEGASSVRVGRVQPSRKSLAWSLRLHPDGAFMPRTTVAPAGVLSRQRVHALAVIGATLLGVYLCYRLVEPFLPALAWGLALAVVAYPIHKVICRRDRKSTRLNSSHLVISYAVFCLKKTTSKSDEVPY